MADLAEFRGGITVFVKYFRGILVVLWSWYPYDPYSFVFYVIVKFSSKW